MEFSNQEQIENIDKMVMQYFNLIKITVEDILNMLEKRKELINENKE